MTSLGFVHNIFSVLLLRSNMGSFSLNVKDCLRYEHHEDVCHEFESQTTLLLRSQSSKIGDVRVFKSGGRSKSTV